MRFTLSRQGALRLGSILLSASGVSALVQVTAPPASTSSSALHDSFDYIVVGSGPGGGPLACNLACAGFKTLLLEAGEDESALISSKALYLASAPGNGERLTWSYWVRHYDDIEVDKKYLHLVWKLVNGDLWVGPTATAPAGAEMLGIQYPRGATLGGSSVVNAGLTLLPANSDWDYVKNITGDASWNAAHMGSLFMKLEKNTYLPRGTPGHGFDGYLETALGNGSVFLSSPQATEVLKAMAAEAGQNPADIAKILATEPNNLLLPNRDQTTGLSGMTFHANSTWARYAARERVIDTLNAVDAKGNKKYPLELRLNSFATNVLFNKPRKGSSPRAIGLDYLEGKSLYQGDLRYNASVKGTPRRVYASKEVIISAGSFGSPQLLMLSGVGPAAELKALGIPVVSDLPGVGKNMQEHNEIAVIGDASQVFDFSAAPGGPRNQCTFGAPGDPCVASFLQGQGPYTQAGLNADITFLKTNYSSDGERDIAIFSGPFGFRGLWPDTPNQTWFDPPTTWGMHAVHMHGKNRAGSLKLRSADATVTPDINFRYFQDEGSESDIEALKQFMAWSRRAFGRVNPPLAPFNFTWPPCSGTVNANGSCSVAGDDETFIRENTFGHHVVGTCAIGPSSDRFAVLDSKFRVRGVSNLRVIDASAFPISPGAFPVLPTYMLSEKGAETILSGK